MKKKLLKYFLILISFLFLILIYEITIISQKTINRETISIDINNARNPQIKKILRSLDSAYTAYLLRFNKETKSYFSNSDNRNTFPDEKIIKKTSTFSKNLNPKKNNGKFWHRNYGNSASNRFSSLKSLINKILKPRYSLDYEIRKSF